VTESSVIVPTFSANLRISLPGKTFKGGISVHANKES